MGSAVLGSVVSACGGGGDQAIPDASGGDLSAEEIAGLVYMREEEKLAHDVYLALYARWGAVVFSNIAQSEAQHTELVRQRLVAHGLADPAEGKAAGVFADAGLQALYNTLVSKGQTSLVAALSVGCLIEETDIRDLADRRALVVGEPDIVAVYDKLMCGSRNHARAFNAQLATQGVRYAAQVMSQTEWDAIVSSAQEACGR